MNYLKFNPNKKIGIFSPSMPITVYCPKRYARSKKFLSEKGFHFVEGSLTNKIDGYRSGTIAARAQEFNELLYNNEIGCIIATIGGMNTNAILPYIDYEYLKNHPKLIIGYSDVGALLLAIYAKTGIHTIYGPALLSAFGEIGPLADASFTYFSKLFIEDSSFPHKIPAPYAYSDEHVDWEEQSEAKNLYKNEWICVKEGIAQGRCIVSNLGTLAYTFGTSYFPKIKEGDILVLEDTMDNPMQVERAYAHLKLAGIFELVGGIILGKHALYDSLNTAKKPKDILLEFVEKEIPILADVDIGHTLPVMSFVNGSIIKLNSTKKEIEVIEL